MLATKSVPVSVVAPPSANASGPSDTPASLANGGSGHADTTNSCPARAACVSNLRDYAVRLVNWRHRHCLCRRCRGQGQGCQSDQSDHWLSPGCPVVIPEADSQPPTCRQKLVEKITVNFDQHQMCRAFSCGKCMTVAGYASQAVKRTTVLNLRVRSAALSWRRLTGLPPYRSLVADLW